MNVRIQFEKGYEVKYVSHLDLMRTFNRMLMRSGLPISYTQGFNPHIILTFAQPLSVGVTSDGEFAEFQLEQDLPLDEIRQKLNRAAPQGIRITHVTDRLEPKFKELASAVYEVTMQTNVEVKTLCSVLDKKEILIEKKTKKGLKEIDIRPLIFSCEIRKTEPNQLVLTLHLAAGSEKNLNPDLLLKAFERYIPDFQLSYKTVHRTNLLSKNGRTFCEGDGVF